MKIAKYINEVRSEMTHVSWPSRAEAVTYTVLVIVISAVIALFTGAVDLGALEVVGLLTK